MGSWLIGSLVLSVVLTIVLNIGLRIASGFRTGADSSGGMRGEGERVRNPPDLRDGKPGVRVIVPWKTMVIGSLVLTILLNLALLSR